MNTTFRARTIPTAPDELSMSLVCRWGGLQLEIGLSERIPASAWNEKKRELNRRHGCEAARQAVIQLDHRSSEVKRQFQFLSNSLHRLPTSDEFRSFMKGQFNPLTGEKVPFLQYIESFISEFDQRPMRGDLVNGSKATRKKYQSHLNILKVFAEEEGEELTWENMNGAFCTKMKKWRARQPAKRFTQAQSAGSTTAQTTISRWVKAVRGWLSMAHREGIHPYKHFQHPDWKTKEGEVLRWVLSDAQLRAFKDFGVIDSRGGEGPPRTGLKRVKDLFVVQCLTGVRFSDLDKVIQSFNEDPDRAVIAIVTGKTKAQVTIPVHPWIVEIASDYSAMQLPLAGSSQKFNQQLRRIALESGLFDGALDKPSIDSAGNATVERTTQWEQLSSHTARRTFATMAIQKGVPTKVVMNITGHNTEREFNKYVNISGEQNAELFRQYWG